jgi:predicted nucleic acid-binding protein
VSELLYLDASAFVKLGRVEPESDALRARLQGARITSSALAEVEVHRALARAGVPQRAAAILADVVTIEIAPATRRAAIHTTPPTLRSLDAIHLATAQSLGAELDALICYDVRLADAARAAGLPVESPGR